MKTSQKSPKSSKIESKPETIDTTASATPRPVAKFPPQYSHLLNKSLPPLLFEALKHFGTLEVSGKGDNPKILGWAAEIGGWVASFYTKDETPWCGLFVAYCAKMAGHSFGQRGLAARDWANWGRVAPRPSLGDILVFARTGGGHVGFYVGEDEECFHVLGGNQNNSVCIVRIERDRLIAARRPVGQIANAESVKPVILGGTTTEKSTSEA